MTATTFAPLARATLRCRFDKLKWNEGRINLRKRMFIVQTIANIVQREEAKV